MRERNEIMKIGEQCYKDRQNMRDPEGVIQRALILEVMLDIRGLLANPPVDISGQSVPNPHHEEEN